MHDKRSFELVFQPTGLLRQAAFMCEARVFDETYGVALPEHIVEFAPYEDASAFIAVVDDRHDVVAAMRLITPSPVGLKTIHESCGEPWHLDGPRAARAVGMDMTTTWDIATLGVPRGIGRHRFAVTAALYHGLVIVARENNVRSIVMNVDERVRTVLNMAGLVTNALPGAKPGPFCGSPASTPVYAHCAQMLDTQRRINPDGYRLIAQGIGLDAVSVPSAANFVHMPGENDRVLLGSTRTAVPA